MNPTAIFLTRIEPDSQEATRRPYSFAQATLTFQSRTSQESIGLIIENRLLWAITDLILEN
jgi:hypothetical protein